MSEQQFHRGDLVRVADDLGPSMKHFSGAGSEAVVVGSYVDQFGGDRPGGGGYTLYLRGDGSTSWYYESQLTLVEPGRVDLLETWEAEIAADAREKSDLAWIFAHGEEVAEKGYGASIAALARCLGVENLWGSHGEGFVYVENCLKVLALADPYLVAGDEAGWRAFATSVLANGGAS